MNGIAFRLLGPPPTQQRTAHRLNELRDRTQQGIDDIDAALKNARTRRRRSIEQRSTPAQRQERPVGVPIQHHTAGRIIGIR